MRCMAIFAVSLLCFAQARVTFQYSTVLQAHDIAGTKANFKCKNACAVYVDRKSSQLVITQNGANVATFDEIIQTGPTGFPKGLILPPNDEYYLENEGEVNPAEFVFYVVESDAPNYGVKVVVPQEKQGIAIKNNDQYVTVLSSFEAMWFSAFTGNFPAGYPRIYAAPYDAIGNSNCRAVYQARSRYNAEQSCPIIASAVFTIDFGFVGAHNASVNNEKIKDMTKAAGMSTVYTSPGYVGCGFNTGQNYYSKFTSVQDKFTLQAESLDIDATFTGLTDAEPVTFTVNNKLNNFVSSGTYNDHFGKGSNDVEISWTRATASASFAIQMDFSNGDKPPAPTTTLSPNPPPPTTTVASNPPPPTTTVAPSTPTTSGSSGISISAMLALALVVATCLW